jgi:hypothetical protein
VLLKHLPYSESKEAFDSKLEGIGATNLYVISEFKLLEIVSRFGALLLSNIQESEAHNFDWIIKLIGQAVETVKHNDHKATIGKIWHYADLGHHIPFYHPSFPRE